MNGWIILLIVLAVLYLISLIRVGGMVKYGPGGLTVRLIAGPARIKLFPAPEKKEKPDKPQKEKKQKKRKKKPAVAEEHLEKKAGTVGRVLKMLPIVAEAAGKLRRKIRIDELTVGLIWGDKDPAATALGYGRANAVFGMIWPLLDHNFKVKHCHFHVDLDYAKTKPELTIDTAVTAGIGQLFWFGVHYLIKLFINWSRSGKALRETTGGVSYERSKSSH